MSCHNTSPLCLPESHKSDTMEAAAEGFRHVYDSRSGWIVHIEESEGVLIYSSVRRCYCQGCDRRIPRIDGRTRFAQVWSSKAVFCMDCYSAFSGGGQAKRARPVTTGPPSSTSSKRSILPSTLPVANQGNEHADMFQQRLQQLSCLDPDLDLSLKQPFAVQSRLR